MNCLNGWIIDHPLECICIFLVHTFKTSFGRSIHTAKNSFTDELLESDLINKQINRVKGVLEKYSLKIIIDKADNLVVTHIDYFNNIYFHRFLLDLYFYIGISLKEFSTLGYNNFKLQKQQFPVSKISI